MFILRINAIANNYFRIFPHFLFVERQVFLQLSAITRPSFRLAENICEVFERESAVCRYNPFSPVSDRSRRSRRGGRCPCEKGGRSDLGTDRESCLCEYTVVRKQYCERAIR